MRVEALELAGVLLVRPQLHADARGFFCETYNRRTLEEAGLVADFVQDNHSLSRAKGVVRGLHFQSDPHAQGKLVRCIRGAIFDVAVDIRVGSPTFGCHVARTLTPDNHEQLWIPAGFAHGFCTLVADTEIIYKVTDYYAPECDLGLAWDDPALGIDWPVDPADAVLSDKDRKQPRLSELGAYFCY